MAELRKRKAEENLSAALARMGLQVSEETPSHPAEKAMGPGATAPSSLAQAGILDVRYSPEPPAPPAAAAPRDPGEE
jgi:hypothetical protein